MLVAVAEGDLELREESSHPRDGQRHAAKFPQELVPFLGGDTTAALHGVNDVVEALLSVGRQ